MKRWTTLLAGASVCVAALGGCGSDSSSSSDSSADSDPTSTEAAAQAANGESESESGSGSGPETGAVAGDATESAVAEAGPEAQADVDQTPPSGINGIAVAGSTLYVASINSNQVLGIDAATGAIVGRWGTGGELGGPDDLVVDQDGTLLVAGFGTGAVSRIAIDGTITELGNVGAGANPINLSPAGELFVGRALTGDGLYRYDAEGKKFVEVTPTTQGLNGFDFSDDGSIIGPLLDFTKPGRIARVDPDSGDIEVLVDGLGAVTGVEVDGDVIYAAQVAPPALLRMSLQDPDSPPATVAELPFASDNIALGADGTVYATSFSTPEIAAISPAGDVRLISIGA